MAQFKTEWFELEDLFGGCYPTLDNLVEYLQLGGKCRQCGHIYPLDRHELARRFGKDQYIAGLKSKLKCVPCDKRGNSVFVVAKLPR